MDTIPEDQKMLEQTELGDTSPGSPGSSSETDSGEEGAGGSESGDGDNEEWEKALNWLDL
jgi:hypothetical protein